MSRPRYEPDAVAVNESVEPSFTDWEGIGSSASDGSGVGGDNMGVKETASINSVLSLVSGCPGR